MTIPRPVSHDAHLRVPFVDLRAQYETLRDEVEARMGRVLESGSFILGPHVLEFEHAFADYLDVRHAIGLANGTDALLLTLKALGIGPGDEVITAANTFVATVEAIVHAGARPFLVDIDPASYTLDPARVGRAVTPRTRALIVVHLYGQSADLDALAALARRHDLILIEDATQAHGAWYRGQRVGSIGRAACFSFYPAKNLGAYGDAGAAVTNDDDLARSLRKLRDHGSAAKYDHEVVGYNSRLDELQAAVLLAKLPHLDRWNALRQNHAHRYDALLSGVPGVTTPVQRAEGSHVFHLYVIRVAQGERDTLREYLGERGIGTGIHYPQPVHLTAAFRHLGYRVGAFPVAEAAAAEVLSLPVYPELTEEQVAYVAQQIAQFQAGR